MATNSVTVTYPGVSFLFSPFHRFEAYLDMLEIVPRQKYSQAYEARFDIDPGSYKLECRSINEVTGWRHSSFFNVEIPEDHSVTLILDISRAWGSWREPVVLRDYSKK